MFKNGLVNKEIHKDIQAIMYRSGIVFRTEKAISYHMCVINTLR